MSAKIDFSKITAEELIARGYRRTSNRYRMVSRIDAPDWQRVMAHERSKSNPEAALRFIEKSEHAADMFRTTYSKDSIENVPRDIFKKIPHSSHDPVGWIDPATFGPLPTIPKGPAEQKRGWKRDPAKRLRSSLWENWKSDAWEEFTLYLVEIACSPSNPVHEALMLTGFINDGQPSSYTYIYSQSTIHEEHELYFINVVARLRRMKRGAEKVMPLPDERWKEINDMERF